MKKSLLFLSVLLCTYLIPLISFSQYYPGGFAKSQMGFWFDVSDSTSLTKSSGRISAWKDKVNGTLVAAQSTAAKQPNDTLQDGRKIVNFNGAVGLSIPYNSALVPANGFNIAQVLYVYPDMPITVNSYVGGTYSSNNAYVGSPYIGVHYVVADSMMEICANRNNTGYYYSNFPDVRSRWTIASTMCNATNTLANYFYNGSGTLSSVVNGYLNNNYGATIGNHSNANTYYNVHWGVGETVQLNIAGGATANKILCLYLGNKWGMRDSLLGGTNALFAPKHPSYTNALVGIGMEGIGDSITSTGSNNGLGFQNVAGTKGFLRAQGDYLFAADNASSGTQLLGTTFTRWSRAWYIQKSDTLGFGGLVNVFFDFGTYGNTSQLDTLSNSYYLLYNKTNGNFNSDSNYIINTSAAYLLNGNQLYFQLDVMNLPKGGFYTLVTAPKGTALSLIPNLGTLKAATLNIAGAAAAPKVVAGNTLNYIGLDSTQFAYPYLYYKVYVSVNGGAMTVLDSTAANARPTYYAHYNLTNGNTYSYAFSAVFAPGKESQLSPTAQGVPGLVTPSWSMIPQNNGYGRTYMKAGLPIVGLPLKYYFDNPSGGGHVRAYNASASYMDTGLASGSSYSYRYQWMDSSKGVATQSGWSSTLSVGLYDSAKGGFTYALGAYDLTTIYGHDAIGGPAPITPSNQDMSLVRMIKHAPPIGQHPRVFCNPDDSTSIRWRLANTYSGKAAAKWIHAYTSILNMGASGNGNFNANAYYNKDTMGNAIITNNGQWNVQPHYNNLAAGDTGVTNNYSNLWNGQYSKMAYLFSQEAMECWLYRGQTDGATGMSYNSRATKLAKAITVWAKKALADTVNPLNPANAKQFGGANMYYVYDFLYNQMTKGQQDTVRMALMAMLPDSTNFNGLGSVSIAATSNWLSFPQGVTYFFAVEGEPGYTAQDSGTVSYYMRTLWNFMTYGVYSKTGNLLEAIGKDQLDVPDLVAAARRGYSMLGHPSVYNYGSKYIPGIIQPFGYSFVGTDLLGGTQQLIGGSQWGSPATGGWRQGFSDVMGLKWVFPTDTAIDFVWKNYMQKPLANSPYNPNISPNFYFYTNIGDNYGNGVGGSSYFNTRLTGLLFASDYFSTPFATQAKAAYNNSLVYFDSLGGFATLRSGYDSAASTVFFANRTDMGGHTYANKNEVVYSALGRIWFPRPSSNANGMFDALAATGVGSASGILVNNYGASIDTTASSANGGNLSTPGKIPYFKTSANMLSIAGDATIPYSYKWYGTPFGYSGQSPNLGAPGYTQVTATPNSFRYSPNYSFDDVSYYDGISYNNTPYCMPTYHRYTQQVFSPNGVYKKMFRTVAMIQGAKPYVIIADDNQLNSAINNYRWFCQLPSDVTIDSRAVNLSNNNYQYDVILKETTGNRRLLIRMLNINGPASTTTPGVVDTNAYALSKLNRLFIESNSIDPQFKALLFPYNLGDSLPVTNWSSDKSKVYISVGGVTNTISFIMDSTGRTNIGLNSPDTGYYWTGATSTDWNTATNWGAGRVPVATDNIIIPAGVSNMPIVAVGATANKVTVQSGANLKVDSVLQLNGDLINLGTINGVGTIKTYSNSPTPFNEGQVWNVNIEYNRSKGGQTLVKGTYAKRLSINASVFGSITTAADTIVLNGTLNISAGNYLNMSTNILSGTLTAVTGTGILQTQCLANSSLPTGEVWPGKVVFNAASGNQSIPAGTYQNLSVCSATMGTNYAIGNLSVIDSLYIGSMTTFDLGVNALSGAINYNAGNGILKTANTTTTPLPLNKNWNIGIAYYSTTGIQTVVNGAYNTLDISGGTTGGRILPAGGLFSISGNLIPNTGSGALTTTNDTITFNGTSLITAAINLNNIIINSGSSLTSTSGVLGIAGNFINNGSFSANGGTVLLNGTNQSITGSNTFFNLNKTATAACTLTLQSGATQTISGTLTLSGFYNNLLTLNASISGTQASINPMGARVISYVAAKDNNNVNATAINPINSYSYGNLTNWSFGPATFTWTGATDTKWNTASNWTPAIIPGVSDTVLVKKTGANNLSLEASVTVGALIIDTFSTVSLNAQTLTTKGNITNNGTFNGNTGTTVIAGTSTVSGVGSTNFNHLTINSGYTLTSTSAINVSGNWLDNGSFVQSSGVVNFNGTTAQTITKTGGESFGNLTVSNTTATVATSVPLTIANSATLTISNGAVLDMGTNVLSTGATFTTSGTGTLNTQNTTALPLPTGKTWAFTVNYNNATGAQTLSNGTYTTGLKAGNTSGTDTLNGTTTVNGTLTVNGGVTLDCKAYTLTAGTGFTNDGLGTIKTKGTFPSNKSWTGTVVFNSTVAYYTIQPGTYNNLDLDGGTGAARNMDAGSGVGTGTFNINGALTWSGTGGIAFNKTTINYAGNNQTVVSGLSYYNVGFTGTDNTKPPVVTTLNIGGAFNPGIMTGLSSGTISFVTPSGGGVPQPGQTIPAFNFYNLTISGARTVNITFSPSGTIGVAGTFNPTATFTGSGYVTTGSTINFNGTVAQTIPKLVTNATYNYGSIQISNNAGVSFGASLMVNKDIVLTNGTLNLNGKTDTVAGNITVVSGNINAKSGALFLNGSSAQSIGNAAFVTDSIATLAINNSNGVSFAGSVNIISSLNLVNGIVTVGGNGLTIKSGAFFTGASSTAYINGRLTLPINSITATTFPIGSGGNYRPVVFAYTTTPGSQYVGIQQYESQFPSIPAGSSVGHFGNRYWNISQSTTGLSYTISLNGGGASTTGTVIMLRREGSGAGTSNSVTTSLPTYTNASSFSTSNVSNDVALGETGIPLTIVGAVSNNKVYDGTTNAIVSGGSLVGVSSGDVVILNQSGTFATRNVGSGIVVTPTCTISGANAAAYTLTQPTLSAKSITVRPITVIAVADSKVYDGTTTSSATPSYVLQTGDATVTAPIQTYDNKNVGTNKVLTPVGLVINDGNSGNNYSISYATAAVGTITALPLTIAANVSNKEYDGNTTASVTPSIVSGSLISGDVANFIEAYLDKNVSTAKTIVPSGSVNDGNGGNNYSYTFVNNTSSSITAKALTATVTASNKIYDANSTASISFGDNRLTGDVLTVNYSTATFSDKYVAIGKSVSVTGITLSGTDAANYSLTATSATTTANITPFTLVITPVAANKVYDANTSATVSFTDNKFTGDDVSETYTSANFDDKNVGVSKAVSISGIGLSGADAGNYSLTASTASTSASISAKSLTVSATSSNKSYDGNTTATVSLSDNRVAGDILSFGYATAVFADKNIGTGKTVTVNGITVTGTDAGNYSLVANTANTFANITSIILTVTVSASNKTYDGNTTATVSLGDNRIAGDNLIISNASATFSDKNVANGKTVTVSGITVSGTDAGNYTLGNTTATSSANITPATLTITANNQNKNYQGYLVLGNTAFTTTGLISPDVVTSVTLTNSNTGTGISPTTDALGAYNIIPSAATGSGLSNYSVVYVNGTLTVQKTTLYVWTGATNTSWSTATNWSPNGTPTAIDSVSITKTGSNNLSMDVSPTVAYLSISSGNTVSLNGQTLAVTGNWVNNGVYNGGTGTNVFAWTTTTSGTGTNNFNHVTINSGATLAAAASSTLYVSGNWVDNGSFTPSTGTVVFNGTTTQSIAKTGGETFNNLSITNTSAKVTAINNITLGASATLNIASNAILDLTTNALSGGATALTTSGTGTLMTQYQSSNPITIDKVWNFDVVYNNASGSQSVQRGTYNGLLSIANTSGLDTLVGNVVINGTFNLGTGASLDAKLYSITGTLAGSIGLGTLYLGGNNASGGNYQIPLGKNWSGNVVFNGVGSYINHRIPPGNYNNLQLDVAAGSTSFGNQATEAGTIKVAGTLTTSSTVFTPNLTTFEFSGTNQPIPASMSFYNLKLSGTGTIFPNGTVNISNQFTNGSVTSATQGTINFNGTGAQTIPAFNYNTLVISGARTTNNVTLANAGTIGVASTLTHSATYTTGALVNTGSTVNYNGIGAQTITAINYNNLTISGAHTTNNITLASGATIGVAGNFSYSPTYTTGTLVNTNNTLLFNGTSNQSVSVPNGISLYKVTLNNTTTGGGTISLSGNMTIANTLTLTAGKLDVGSSNLTLNSGVTVTTPSASSYIVTSGVGGLIRKAVTTATLFPVGTSTSYAPLTVTNNTASDMTIGVSPTITNAVLDTSRIVKLQWSVASSVATTATTLLHQFNTANMASAFAVGSTCDEGWYTSSYTVSSVGTPVSLGGGAYTLSKSGLALPAGTTNYSVLGNTGSIYMPMVFRTRLANDLWASNTSHTRFNMH